MCLGNPLSDPNLFSQREAPSKKALELKQALEYILVAHFIVGIFKIILGGLNAGMNDFFSCLILWCGYSRYDYC
jgi:hypothetical protein